MRPGGYIGERGPQPFVLKKGERVLSYEEVQRILSRQSDDDDKV